MSSVIMTRIHPFRPLFQRPARWKDRLLFDRGDNFNIVHTLAHRNQCLPHAARRAKYCTFVISVSTPSGIP